jgi:hypothetical protein
MGKNSRRRRVDKQRRAADRRRRNESTRIDDRGSATGPDQPVACEHDDGPEPTTDPASEACRRLEQVLGIALRDRLWVHGWQPDELLRQLRRAGGADLAHVLAMAITADTAHHDRVGDVIHESWRRQTERIAAQSSHQPGRDGWLARWLDAAGRDVGLAVVHALLDQLLSLQRLPLLVAPPGRTGDAHVDVVALDVDAAPSPKLVTIRGLLAKAESTEFPAEAEVFTAKAQAMMIEARLDEATVRASSSRGRTGRVSAVRLAIDEPYVASKQVLLHVVAEANDVRCVFHRGVDLATLVGPVGQLAHVELLFTSLLIQAQSALAADAADAPPGSRIRSRRYRSSFIVGFAERIGERLREARDAAFARVADDALPVLAADDRATAELFERVVGPTTSIRSSARYDPAGVRAGARAADRAALREAGLRGSANGASGQLRDAS